MKKVVFVFLWCLASCSISHAQMAFEAKAGSSQAQYFAFQQLQIDSVGRWGMFASQLYLKPYQAEATAFLSLENQLSYQLLPGIGLSAGLSMDGTQLRPNVGLALEYFNRRGDFFISAFPTWLPGALGGLELFFVSEYAPQWNKSWGFFGQWIGGLNALRKQATVPNERGFAYAGSTHMIRLGFNYRQKWQLGWGVDLMHERGMKTWLALPGPFVRLAL